MEDTNRPSEFELFESKGRKITLNAPDCSRGILWMPLAFVFLATSLATLGYIIHMKISDQTPFEEDLMKRYPGVFRTEEEQRQFAEEYFNKTRYRSTGDLVDMGAFENCTFPCNGYATNLTDMNLNIMYSPDLALIEGSTVDIIYHACCESKTKWDSPEYAYNFHDQWVKLAVIKKRKQYFLNETCSQANGCNACTCTQDQTFASAVINDNGNSVLQSIKVPGCCHCLNVQPKKG